MTNNYNEVPEGPDFAILFNSVEVKGVAYEQRYDPSTQTTDVRIRPAEHPVRLTINKEALWRDDEAQYFARSVIEQAQLMRGRLLDGLGVPEMIRDAEENAAKREHIAVIQELVRVLDEELRLNVWHDRTLKFVRTLVMKLGPE